jgi:hypothetical protein
VTLTGFGTLILDPGNSAQRSRIGSTNINYVLTNDTNHTIMGAGYIGEGNMGSSTGEPLWRITRPVPYTSS